jgi:hypothetical protein
VARSQEAQRQRTQNNPLVLGSFDTLALKYLKGRLGPLNQVVGRADTSQQSNGGFGGGTYNHWFQINLKNDAWIIVTKSGTRPNYIQTSVYDLNKKPIEGRGVFQGDSVSDGAENGIFYPYIDTVMGAQSDLYNTFVPARLDRGDERYYPLEAGGYLLCVSTTRNEPLDYEVGLVVEFPITEMFISLEDEADVALFLQETAIDFLRTISVISPVTVDTIISSSVNQPNGFTKDQCVINSGVTVTVLFGSEWFIGPESTPTPSIQGPGFAIIAEPGNDLYFDTIHDHSLEEWQESWESTHQDTDKFPSVFIPLTNRP